MKSFGLSLFLLLPSTLACVWNASAQSNQQCKTFRIGSDIPLPQDFSFGFNFPDEFTGNSQAYFSGDGSKFFISDHGLCAVLDVKLGRYLLEPTPCEESQMDRQGTVVLFTRYNDVVAQDLKTGSRSLYQPPNRGYDVSLSPDGRFYSVPSNHSSREGKVTLIDRNFGKNIVVHFSKGLVTNQVFSPDSKTLVVVVRDDVLETTTSSIFFYDLETGKKRVLPVNGRHISTIKFSPDSKRLLFHTAAPGMKLNDIREYDLASEKTKFYAGDFGDYIGQFRFSNDAKSWYAGKLDAAQNVLISSGVNQSSEDYRVEFATCSNPRWLKSNSTKIFLHNDCSVNGGDPNLSYFYDLKKNV